MAPPRGASHGLVFVLHVCIIFIISCSHNPFHALKVDSLYFAYFDFLYLLTNLIRNLDFVLCLSLSFSFIPSFFLLFPPSLAPLVGWADGPSRGGAEEQARRRGPAAGERRRPIGSGQGEGGRVFRSCFSSSHMLICFAHVHPFFSVTSSIAFSMKVQLSC